MKETHMKNILVIGVDTNALAASATKAGYNVFSVDYFGDQDLRETCKNSLAIIDQQAGQGCGHLKADFSPAKLLNLAKKLREDHQLDATLLASGLEDAPQVLTELNGMIPIVGNPPQTIRRLRDKSEFFGELERLNIHHPETAVARSFEEGKRIAKDIGFPVLVKPAASFGGSGIRKAKNMDELDAIFPPIMSLSREVLIQEYLEGTNASVSFLSSGQAAVVLTVNEQFLGDQKLGQREPFGYCGNLVPLTTDNGLVETCSGIAQKLTSYFKLRGSNGLDVVISEVNTPYVIEVNPRFQGTLECVERVLGVNLVDLHMDACNKGIISSLPERDVANYCVRLVLYAYQRSTIPNLTLLRELRDIPQVGAIIEKGEALCSIVVEGKTKDRVLKKAEALAWSIYRIVKTKLQ